MHVRTATAPASRASVEGRRVPVLLAGLAGAVAVRVGVAGQAGVRSVPAGLVFAALLLAVAVTATPRIWRTPGPALRQVAVGLAGAAALCAVPLSVHLRTPVGPLPLGEFPVWAVVVTVVAVAEEVLLRGVLWAAAERRHGTTSALLLTTVSFGLLHVPLYGLAALPLDLAVGLLLGGLRMASGGWAAPALAHTVADLAGWWLR